jgi:pimeloyl-ACP methyl ester carboxylesterase
MFNVLPPSPFCFALEPFQAMRDYVAGHMQLRDLSLQGDGHPVLVFPGLGLSGGATADLRVRLQQLGYAVYDWNHGFNHGPGLDFDAWLSLLSRQLQEIHDRHECSVSIIGWSLGGIYARELAKLHPQRTRQVITLGTPFVKPGLSATEKMFSAMTGANFLMNESLLHRLSMAPPVPCSSIYSQADVFVNWQTCIGEESTGHRNIEVKGVSHYGMVHHPEVLTTIAGLLQASVPDAPEIKRLAS